MAWDDIREAAQSVADQIGTSMRGLRSSFGPGAIYAFALVVQDDFATVYKFSNTVGHFEDSDGGPESRWEPAEWVATGMELDQRVLFDKLGDPTFQTDASLEAQRPHKQALWLAALVEGLILAHSAGHLEGVFAFCTVQDSGLIPWLTVESAKLANSPEQFAEVGEEFTEVWEAWESDEEAEAVEAAFAAIWATRS
jgi:hypothetical protein